LNGRRIVCRVDLDSRPDQRGGFTIYDCASLDDTYRTVWLFDGEQVEGTMTVEATLHMRYVPPGLGFEGFWEYQLVDAVRKETLGEATKEAQATCPQSPMTRAGAVASPNTSSR
jgi:hypothetical protein